MALVYLARNVCNGKLYVGMTTKSLERRVYMHIWTARSNGKSTRQSIFGFAIRKYGPEAFHFQVIADGLTREQAFLRERDLIAELKPEYNVSSGGIGPTNVRWTPERHKFMADMMRRAWTPERRARHRERTCGKPPAPEVMAKMKAARKANRTGTRGVVCLSDNRWFPAIIDAAAAYGVHHTQITSSCSGREVTAGGFSFAYAKAPLTMAECQDLLQERTDRLARRYEAVRRARSRPVVCLNDGVHYPSGAAAARAYGIHQMAIVQCCKYGSRTNCGRRFRYEDEPARDRHAKSPERLAAIRKAQTKGLAKSWKAQCKKVLCVDTGVVYESITEAAEFCGKTVALVSAAIYRKGRCAGYRFAFVPSKDEP